MKGFEKAPIVLGFPSTPGRRRLRRRLLIFSSPIVGHALDRGGRREQLDNVIGERSHAVLLPLEFCATVQRLERLGACPSSGGIFGTNLIPFAA
jgi:hypothetical protein